MPPAFLSPRTDMHKNCVPVFGELRRRGLERTVRKALQLPLKPAVFYLHAYQPEYEEHSFWQGGETQIDTIMKYYGIPSVSARDALYHLMIAGVDGFADAQVHCTVHPNPLGHTCVNFSDFWH